MRRANDFYPTPDWATRELLARVDVRGYVLEPCAGRGDIATALACDPRVRNLELNDLDKQWDADTHEDATDPIYWQHKTGPAEWVVTNPPFLVADKILPLAVKHVGRVAMLLRITYLEPCEGRAAWLRTHPPARLIVLPRISFTGDGKTDSVTCAWFVWDRFYCGQSIEVVSPAHDTVDLFQAGA